MRNCSKPACPRPATVVLGYDYAGRTAMLEDALEGAMSPHLYGLCTVCAERLQPPKGWELEERRTSPAVLLRSDAPVR